MIELREMAKRGHEPILVAPPDSDIFRRGLDFQIRTLPLSMRRLDFYQNLEWLTDFFRSEKVDVVNTHSSRDSWLAGFAARKAKVPLAIKTRHISARVSRGWLTRLVYQKLHDYIITTSTSIAEDMVRFNGFDSNRIAAIPTGVDLDRFDLETPRLDLRHELGLPPEARLIGMVSVLRSWKGHPDFLRAAVEVRRRCPNACFVIVGEGPRRSQIEKDLLDMQVEDFVFLTGHRDEIPQILRDLEIFVLPSYANEGVPQALLQAMAMQCPAVATAVGGIPEVITSGSHGLLCEPKNSHALAARILQFIENPIQAREMARAARRRVEEHFSLQTMMDHLEGVYARMLNGKGEPPPADGDLPATSNMKTTGIKGGAAPQAALARLSPL